MTVNQVVRHYGGVTKAANALKVSRQIIQYWKRHDRIPLKTQGYIELQSQGALKSA